METARDHGWQILANQPQPPTWKVKRTLVTDKTVGKREEKGRENNLLSRVPMLETRTLEESADNAKLFECPNSGPRTQGIQSLHLHIT